MLKKIYSMSLSLLCLCTTAQITNPAPFCAQSNTPTQTWQYAPISNVKLCTATNTVLNNTTGYGTNGGDYTYYNNLATHTLVLGVPQIISVTFSACNIYNSQYFSVYLDLDGNNQFSAAERIFDNAFAGNVPIPPASAATFTSGFTVNIAPLGLRRMRVMRGGNPTQTNGTFVQGFVVLPCPTYTGNLVMNYGEVEDYDVLIAAAPPTANFNLFLSSVCAGSTVSPIDQSSNNVTYTWTATGALPATSNLQSPQFVYPAPGIYSLSLSVSNATGVSTPIVKTITVNPKPAISIMSSIGGTASISLICKGRSATLTAVGAGSYSWSTGNSGSSIVVSPTVTSAYTLSVTSVFGCSSSSAKTFSVQNCTGLEALNSSNITVNTYPNPGNGVFNVDLSNDDPGSLILEVYNSLGELVVSKVAGRENSIDLSADCYKSGIYYLKIGQTDLAKNKLVLMKD